MELLVGLCNSVLIDTFTRGTRLLWQSWASETRLRGTPVPPWRPRGKVCPLISSCFVPGWRFQRMRSVAKLAVHLQYATGREQGAE